MVTLFETQGTSAYSGYIYLKSDVSPISLSAPINVDTNQGFSTACNSAFYFVSNTSFKYFAIFDSQPTFTSSGDISPHLKQSGNYWYAYGELVTYRNQAPLREGVLTVFDNNADYVDFITAPVQYSGGAGSGYIGNSLVSNKKMVGYNVPTSDVESTKTESVNEASAAPISGKPKSGNGFARIMLKHRLKYYTLEDLVKQSDLTHYKKATYSGSGDFAATFLQLSEWFGTDWNLSCVAWSGADYPTKSDNVYTYGNNQQLAYGLYAFAISKKVKVWAYGFDGKFNNVTQDPDHQMHLRLYVLENATYNLTNSIFIGQGSGEGAVNDTDWHTYEKKLSEPSYCNYITFYNGMYVDQLKNIWVLVEE